jgi:hypothetical protein
VACLAALIGSVSVRCAVPCDYLLLLGFHHLSRAFVLALFIPWLITVTGIKERTTGVTVRHGLTEEVEEGMMTTGMGSVGNLTMAYVVLLLNLFIFSSVLIRDTTRATPTKNSAMRPPIINSLRADHRTLHKILLTTTGTRKAFKEKSVWSLANPVPTSSS